ncbi:hypothetical protein RHGRI_017965 [Rhododendron griersonianum]|uniref:Partial AB-hydrolase lipase domain-containing protein n=1 Tax=Rhododendron griersonianum TaxID=479676 RepID=A0AAV6JZW0_9ERIC|nr:hypothetical protein RHGRI_017965 [Rhododendron griersonianum]
MYGSGGGRIDGVRQVPYTINTKNGRFLSSSDSDVGICKSIVETQGYSCEEHTVTTADGYIVSLQRIPVGRSGVTADKPPVLFAAWAIGNAATWLLNTPDQSLGFILADNGYDAYWDWSWDELAAHDLPASVQYVYDQTGQNLHYVGHSLGTLMALAAFSKQQSLNMIRSAALLSPIAYLDQITTLLGKAAAYSMIGPPCCISPSTMDAVFKYGPQPTATKNMLHLAQMVRQGTIASSAHTSNVLVYNMSSIPNDPSLFLAHGGQDYLLDPADVQTLMGALSDHDADKLVEACYWKQGKDNTHMNSMANSLTICILVFLLCVSADGARQVPYTINTNNGRFLSSLDSDVGICESMVEPQGYSCEKHTVTTTDGYILSLQRIPAGRSGVTADKPPVLLQHGVFSDATTWLVNTPDQSLGFILADNGYDVWLANTRGTKYSSGHTSLSPSDPAYWNWSWDELAGYDLPASVQYGTLMALAAFSKQQSLNMIRSAALLSPIAYLDQITTLLGKAAAYSMIGDVTINIYYHILTSDSDKNLAREAVTSFMKGICKITNIDCSSESSLTSAFAGNINLMTYFPSTMDAVAKYGPQPTATKNMLHLAQMVRQGTIAMYDYGSEDDNNEHYGQPTPPVYNMSSIPNDLPLFLAHGGQDYLSDPMDVQTLMGALSDHDADKLVVLYPEEYAHLDFTLAGNANQVVYDPIMGFFSLN